MSTEIEPAPAYANPRPGVLKTLGICNIVFSLLSGACMLWSAFVFMAIASAPTTEPKGEVKVEVKSGVAKPAGVPISMGFNPFFVMQDKNFIRWSFAENGTGLLLNGLMLATGIGLINLRGWAARWWTYGSWARLVQILVLWGYYIVAVTPGLSEGMGRAALGMFAQQGMPPNRMPDLGLLTRVYSIFNLLTAVGAIVVSSIYPAISLWLLAKPGVKAAIVDKPAPEPGLP